MQKLKNDLIDFKNSFTYEKLCYQQKLWVIFYFKKNLRSLREWQLGNPRYQKNCFIHVKITTLYCTRAKPERVANI